MVGARGRGLLGVVGILYGDVAAIVDLYVHASDFLAGLVDRDAVFDIHAGVLLVELRYIIAAGIGYVLECARSWYITLSIGCSRHVIQYGRF